MYMVVSSHGLARHLQKEARGYTQLGLMSCCGGVSGPYYLHYSVRYYFEFCFGSSRPSVFHLCGEPVRRGHPVVHLSVKGTEFVDMMLMHQNHAI